MHAPTLTQWIWLAAIALAGSIVNGVLGHGFSTLSVPLALVLVAQRLLNPVLVLLEVFLNGGSFLVSRRHFPAVWKRVRIFAFALLPGVVLGALALRFALPSSLRLFTYLLLFPLVLFQAFGPKLSRGAWSAERKQALPFGLATGAIYGLTTVSGPVLSVYFHQHDYGKQEYRAAISFLRLVESVATALAYLALGLFSRGTLLATLPLVPLVLLGLGLGALLLRWLSQDAFRHFCIVFNSFAVSFGLAKLLGSSTSLPAWSLHLGWTAVTAAVLVSRFRRAAPSKRLPELAPDLAEEAS